MTAPGDCGARTTCAVLFLTVGACTPFETGLAEFDSIAGRRGSEVEPEVLRYREEAERLPWPIRQLEGTPLYTILTKAVTIGTTRVPVENPAGFARERLRVLVARADSLDRMGVAANRLLWVLDRDPHPFNQVVAIDGLVGILRELGADPLRVPAVDPQRTPPESVTAWIETLEKLWPTRRPPGPLASDRRREFLGALQRLTERPLPSARERRALAGALAAAAVRESDPELREHVRDALRRAIVFGAAQGVVGALAAPHGDVREAAVRGLHRAGGPRAVPFLLARLAKPRGAGAKDTNRYDDARQVRRSLVLICGQIRPPLALRSFRGGPFPAEFLYDTAMSDPDPGLRRVALEALAWSLGRRVDFDPAWAQEWWREYVPSRERDGS